MDSQKIIIKTCGWDDNGFDSIGAWPNFLVWSQAVILVSPQLQTKTSNIIGFCNPSKLGLNFEDDLRSGGLLYCVSQWTSVHTVHWACWQYGHSRGTQAWLGVGERVIWAVGYIQQLKALLSSSGGICWWVCTVESPANVRQTIVMIREPIQIMFAFRGG
jgi:hypothetical protein